MPKIDNLNAPAAGILGRIKALEQRVDDLARNNPVGAGGLTLNNGDSINVNGGSVNVVNGSVDVTEGGSVNVSGGGAAYVDGLKLSAVTPASVGGSASNFAITTASTAVYTASVTVPDGYGTALVMAVCQMDVYNSTTGAIFAYSSVGIGPSSGAESDASVAASTAATLTPAAIQSMSVAGMSSFPISVKVRASAALAASASNLGTVNAIVIFIA